MVESPLLSDAVYDPTDADHSFNAKVMLMAVPPPDVLIEKTCQLAESSKILKKGAFFSQPLGPHLSGCSKTENSD